MLDRGLVTLRATEVVVDRVSPCGGSCRGFDFSPKTSWIDVSPCGGSSFSSYRTIAVSRRAGQLQFLVVQDNSTRFNDARTSDSKAMKRRRRKEDGWRKTKGKGTFVVKPLARIIVGWVTTYKNHK